MSDHSRPTSSDWLTFREQNYINRVYAKDELRARKGARPPLTPAELEAHLEHLRRQGVAFARPTARVPEGTLLATDRVCPKCGTRRACDCWNRSAVPNGTGREAWYDKGSGLGLHCDRNPG